MKNGYLIFVNTTSLIIDDHIFDTKYLFVLVYYER